MVFDDGDVAEGVTEEFIRPMTPMVTSVDDIIPSFIQKVSEGSKK